MDGRITHKGGKKHNKENLQKKDKDGIYCLMSDSFFYFGKEPILLPPELEDLSMSDSYRRGHRNQTSDYHLMKLEEFVDTII